VKCVAPDRPDLVVMTPRRRRPRAVNRARRGTLQNLDRLDVVRIDVGRAVWC